MILQVDPSFGLKVIDDLIESLALPDDHYGEAGAAEGKVASTLADIMVYYSGQVDARIQAEDDLRSALFEVYERMLRTEFELDPPGPPPRAVEIKNLTMRWKANINASCFSSWPWPTEPSQPCLRVLSSLRD
jgi:hypothetical protein